MGGAAGRLLLRTRWSEEQGEVLEVALERLAVDGGLQRAAGIVKGSARCVLRSVGLVEVDERGHRELVAGQGHGVRKATRGCEFLAFHDEALQLAHQSKCVLVESVDESWLLNQNAGHDVRREILGHHGLERPVEQDSDCIHKRESAPRREELLSVFLVRRLERNAQYRIVLGSEVVEERAPRNANLSAELV